MCRRRRRLCRRRSGIEWMSCGGEIRAGRPRGKGRRASIRPTDRPWRQARKQSRIDSISKRTRKSTQTTPSELSTTGEDLWLRFGLRQRKEGRLTADGRNLAMVKSPFYSAVPSFLRSLHATRARGSFIDFRALYPIRVAHVRKGERANEKEWGVRLLTA